jgi:hypothetical protein
MAIGVRRDEEFSGTKLVEGHHRFDEARLDAWTQENVDGCRAQSPNSGASPSFTATIA